jgi:hypothetical protein
MAPRPEAERASTLAEEHLRTLRPDVMHFYDHSAAKASTRSTRCSYAAPHFDHPARADQRAGPGRRTCGCSKPRPAVAARRAAEHTGQDRAARTVPDDPATVRVDEHRDAVTAATPHRAAAAADRSSAAAMRSAADQTAAEHEAWGYPQKVDSTTRTSAAGAMSRASQPARDTTQTTAATTRRTPR